MVVLFVGYQLWGTGVVQAHRQDSLRHQFEESLARQRTADAHRDLGGSSAAALTPEPAIGDPVGTLVIPEIGVDQVIVEGVGSAQLAFGPGHYPGTPLPGQRGNAGIAGHRTTHGRPFYDLNALVAGDPITVTTLQGTFHYLVIRSEVVAPTDLTVLVHSAAPELTLTTCTPRYSAAQRLVVVARLVSSPRRPGPSGDDLRHRARARGGRPRPASGAGWSCGGWPASPWWGWWWWSRGVGPRPGLGGAGGGARFPPWCCCTSSSARSTPSCPPPSEPRRGTRARAGEPCRGHPSMGRTGAR